MPKSFLAHSPTCAVVVVCLTTWPSIARSQVAAGAGAGSTVPFVIGGHHVDVGGGIDRVASTVNPYTLAAARVGTSLGSSSNGFAVRIGTERSLDLAGAPTFGVLQMTSWRQLGDVTLHFDVSSRAAHFSSLGISDKPAQSWVDSSGYQVQRTDTIQQAQDLRLRAWSQLETEVSWEHGPVRWDAVVGARPPVAGLPFAVWGRVATTMRVFRGVAVIAEVGSLPAQVALNLPSARFVHLGLQFNPFAAGRDDRRHDVDRAAAFSVLPTGPQQCTITLRAPGAKTVEIAGDFNGWRPVPLSLASPDVWQVTIGLSEGTYRMNVRIDGGAWTAPPGTVTVTDDFGGTVGLVQVR